MSTAVTGDHQQAAQAGDSNGFTLGDAMKLLQESSGTRKVSAPPPGTRVTSGATQEARYLPTPSLDPRNIELIQGVNEHNIGYVRCAIDAFGECHSGLQRLSDAREQVKKDTSKTEAQHILIVAAEAEKLQDRMTRKMDSSRKSLLDGIKALDDSLNAPLTAKADTTLGREVREYVKNLPQEKRIAFLEDALKQKDTATLHAVLGAQPFLSGISPDMKAHFTRSLHEQAQPEIAQRVAVMRKALALVEQRASLVLTEIPKILGTDWQTIQKLRKTQSAAEQALLLVNNPVQQ